MGRQDQLARSRLLEQALATSRRGVSVREFARKHGFNLRTVYRDLRGLEKSGIPVVEEGGRYRLIENWPTTQIAEVTSEELLALHALRRVSAPIRHTRIGRALDRVWAKLTAESHMPGRSAPAGEQELATRSPPAIDYARHRRVIETLERAIEERRPIDAQYRGLRSDATSSRTIEPGSLYFDPGLESLYLIGWCRLRSAVRVFAVHRFNAATLRDETCPFRPELGSKIALRDAFRVWRGQRVETIRVELRNRAAREAQERTWHQSQQVTGHGDRVVVEFEVAGREELTAWILGFGADAEVLEPEEFREEMSRELRAALSNYSRAPRRPRRAGRRSPSKSNNA